MAQQDQIPDELKIVIQGMIDAKEPPEAINSVIQAYSEGKLKIPPPTARPDQIHIISPKSETEGYWGGVRNSLGFGGTVDQRTREILKQYVAGGILDLPQTAMGLGKHVANRVGEAIAQPARDLYNLPSKLSDASNADLVGMGLKSVGEMSGVPSLYREGKDIYNTLGNVWDTAANSGTDEGGKKWGRLMGQMTLQPLVTEGAIKLGGQVPVRPIYKAATVPIRAAGGPVETAGQWIQYGAKEFPPYSIMRKKRWGGKIIGGGLEKIGGLMKEAGLTQEEINAAALKDFWGDEFGGNVAPGNRGGKGGPSGPSGGGSGGGGGTSDVWGDALKKERNRRFNFDATPENPLTNEFNKPLRGGLHPPEYEPSLPFPKEGEPSPGDLPIEGEQSGLTPEIKKITDKIKAVNITEPNARKDALLRDQGFEPVGKPDAMGRQRYERTRAADEAPITSKETAEESLPQTISLNGLSASDIAEIKATGRYEPGGQGADGFAQFTLKKTTGEVAKDLGKRFVKDEGGAYDPNEFRRRLQEWANSGFKADELFKGSEGKGLGKDSFENQWKQAVKEAEAVGLDWQKYDNLDQLQWDTTRRAAQETVKTGTNPLTRFLKDESGSSDWKTAYLKLRELLGRDPSAAEIEQAMSKEGNVTSMEPRSQEYQKNANEGNVTYNGIPPEKGVPIVHPENIGGFQSHRRGNEEWVTHPSWTEPHGPFRLDSNEAIDHILEYQDSPEFEAYVNRNKGQTGRVAPFEGRVRPPGATRPEDVTGGKEVPLPNVPPELGGSDPTDPNHPFNRPLPPTNDISGLRTRATLGPPDPNNITTPRDMHPRLLDEIGKETDLDQARRTTDYWTDSGIDPLVEAAGAREAELNTATQRGKYNITKMYDGGFGITDADSRVIHRAGTRQEALDYVRQLNVSKAIPGVDRPARTPRGQQDLPLGPHDTMPQVDEYGIPQKRDWSQEDIFRINHEMKKASQPPSSPPVYSPDPFQATIPEFGDDMIQQYLGQEDARPPEMNDINTFKPPHSPDKISFMQKLKDMLDQEDQWA